MAKPTSFLSNRNQPLRMANFSWLAPSPSSLRPPVATMSLTSSHVLLATTSSDEIILLIWDLQFGVLLASYNLSIPSPLSSSSALHLNLTADQENLCKPPPKTEVLQNSPVSGQAYLLVSSMPPSRKGAQKESKVTSVVFVVPYTVPRFSTIAAAMGCGAVSRQWLKDENSTLKDETTTKHGGKAADDAAKDKLLPSLYTALQEGRTQAAEAMFLKWASTIQGNEEETVCSLGPYPYILIDIPVVGYVRLQFRSRTPHKRFYIAFGSSPTAKILLCGSNCSSHARTRRNQQCYAYLTWGTFQPVKSTR